MMTSELFFHLLLYFNLSTNESICNFVSLKKNLHIEWGTEWLATDLQYLHFTSGDFLPLSEL